MGNTDRGEFQKAATRPATRAGRRPMTARMRPNASNPQHAERPRDKEPRPAPLCAARGGDAAAAPIACVSGRVPYASDAPSSQRMPPAAM